MIIQKQKKFEDILKMLEGFNKIFIFGCSDCATVCKTGGEEEVADMKDDLARSGKTVVGAAVLETCCNVNEIRRRQAELAPLIENSDAVLVLACGTGVQSIGDFYPSKRVYPGCDSLFIGEVSRIGHFAEKCSVCGECILDQYDGICPMTRCAKHLLNGPCGGSKNGKCEVDKDKDCAWQLIYARLKERGGVDAIKHFHKAKNYGKAVSPRSSEFDREAMKAKKLEKMRREKNEQA